MEFEWDRNKAESNIRTHGVRFEYATRVFDDPFRMEREADSENDGEQRFQVIGMVESRLLFVVYTDRDDAIRLISARKATSHERRQYHEIST
jgi:uncharacterized DUF497 family protein